MFKDRVVDTPSLEVFKNSLINYRANPLYKE